MIQFASLLNPSISVDIGILRDCYEAFAMYCFGRYLVACLVAASLHVKCERQILTAALAVILEAFDVYCEGDSKLGYPYMAVVLNFSQSWALYCLVMFYEITADELAHIHPLAKFLTFKSIVFLTWWQGVAIALLYSFGVSKTSVTEDVMSYGLTLIGDGTDELDEMLGEYSAFSVKAVDCGVATVVRDACGSSEAKEATYWTTLAPNVEDYNSSVARMIASGSGQMVRGILWCGDVTVDRLKWGNEFLKKRMKGGQKSDVSPAALRRMKRHGEDAAKVASVGMDAVGHAFGMAWAVFKIGKALNPKNVIKPTTLVKVAASRSSSSKPKT